MIAAFQQKENKKSKVKNRRMTRMHFYFSSTKIEEQITKKNTQQIKSPSYIKYISDKLLKKDRFFSSD